MFRRLFTLLAAASLLVCAATCVLWVRSHYRYDSDSVVRAWDQGPGFDPLQFASTRVGSASGRLWWQTAAFVPATPPAGPELPPASGWATNPAGAGRDPSVAPAADPADLVRWERLRFHRVVTERGAAWAHANRRLTHAAVPLWAVVAATVVVPFGRWVVGQARHRRRGRAGVLPRVRVRPPRVARPVPRVRGGGRREAGPMRSPVVRLTDTPGVVLRSGGVNPSPRMPFPLELILVHPEPAMCDAFRDRFAKLPGVRVVPSTFEELGPLDAFVTAGNAFGIMTAGIDAAVVRALGQQVMDRVQARIHDEYLGEQPVGTAFVVQTASERCPFLVHAPTMRVPGSIAGTDKVYASTWAALLAVYRHNVEARGGGDGGSGEAIRSVGLPAMGTGFGGVPYAEAARQMAAAYDHYLHPPRRLDWDAVILRQPSICYDRGRQVAR